MQTQYCPSFPSKVDAPDKLFESNRRILKKIFNTHSVSRDNKIPINEFLNFCKNTKIFPVRII